MNSMSYSNHPLAAVLAKAIEFIGGGQWSPNNQKQLELLVIAENISSGDFESLAMETIASYSADEINGFLARNGFDIRIDALDSNEFGVASILKILMTWIKSSETTIYAQNSLKYQGVKMTENIRLLNSPYCEGYIVEIQSKEGFNIYLVDVPSAPRNEQELFFWASRMAKTKSDNVPAELKSVSFPEIEMDCKPDISWLVGMNNGKNVITQALMQTKFKLDKFGAKAEAAAAIAVRKGISFGEVNLIFNKPFMTWIEKPGLKIPVFVSWCDYDSWK
ncbi:hypothetical protein K9M48_02530 [Candidatus Gracilibacteria bacterium]|nr:hypothetical protein [Candidatus Gracilibacteria bacterium]